MTDYLNDAELEREKELLKLNEELFFLRKENFDLKNALIETRKALKDLEEIPVPPSVIQQVIHLEAENRKLKDDLGYYKKHVQKSVILSRENNIKPVRTGGILRQSKQK